MKKVISIFAVLLLFVSTSGFSQVIYGVKSGLNFANYGGDDGDGMDSRVAPMLGVFLNVDLGNSLLFQPELLFSMKGAKESEGDLNYTDKLNYLDLPMMLKYYISEGFNVQAGPQLSFLLSAKAEYEEDGSSYTEDVKDYVKTLDFGFNLGAGYDFDFGLGIDFRYNLGLSNIVDEDDFVEGDLKNRVFQIGVNYKF
ncbi:porin family protein [Thermophagus sp. OGC60D27]|uniref:porin family protein n=1 Tax=Thermophagus sp. OGC60D27 TaxID=3458415 RepID=UPI00403824D7